MILAAIYMLYMFQKLFLGPLDKQENMDLKDLNWREVLTLAPIIVLIFWIGLYPKPFFTLMTPSVDKLVAALETVSLVVR